MPTTIMSRGIMLRVTAAQDPFRFGEVVSGEAFCDREGELAGLREGVAAGQNVVVISPRRFGKTSLVLQACRDLAASVDTAYVDLFRCETKQDLAAQLAQAIDPLRGRGGHALEWIRRLRVRPSVTVSDSGHVAFTFAAGEDAAMTQTLEELLEEPARIAAERSRRVCLVLDEFQAALDIDAGLPRLVRSVFQHQPQVSHVFLGSRRHVMEQLFTDPMRPLYRSARTLPLGPIASEPFAAFIRERFQATGKRVSEQAIARLLAVTGGHPQDTQQLCSQLWQATAAGGEAGDAELERAVERAVAAEDAYFTAVWDGLSKKQRLLLRAIAQEGFGVYGHAYRQRHQLGSQASVQTALRRLLERELVEGSAERGYRLADTLFAAWLAGGARPDAGAAQT